MSDTPKVDETIDETEDTTEEEDAAKTNDDMFRAAMNTIKQHDFNADDYDEEKHGDLVFTDLDQLDSAFKEEKKVLYWKGEPVAIVRLLAPGEVTDISNSLVSRRVAVALAMSTPGTRKEAEANIDLVEEQNAKSYDLLVKSVQRSVIAPEGLNEKRIRTWSRRKLEFAFKFVTGVVGFDSVDMFHSMDKSSEQQESSTAPDADSEG